ncbi:haloacid dehalogenase type II [Methylobacterium marchantiae]|uniref:(S)-2-haloacid dehalogenase n=1 Tax=Methylobacterium marchantiae TaxID=600331 RepID=A0ABW3WW56_9HYPH|nr:(S)-2-haloacid dehalogenase 4A [Methylobacterium marchantiae]
MTDGALFAGKSFLTGKTLAVFDAYGTLLDVNSAVVRYARDIGGDADAFSGLWRTKQLEYSWVTGLMGRYASFWLLTEHALDYALERYPDIDRALRAALLDAYRSLDAYPDATDTLHTLRRRGVRTAILSNGDASMLAASVSAAGLAEGLDAILSVDPAGIFKTAPAAYEIVLRHFRAIASEVVFFSSNRWDIAGATSFGFDSVWVNRSDLPDEYADLAPVEVIASLSQIA